MRKVSIIIPVHNRAELTWRCLNSIKQNTGYPNWELIIVDNDSTDNTPKILKALSGEVKVLRSEENLGYAKANNWGANEAGGELVCFLNNDTVVTEGWLEGLVDCMLMKPGAVACGGRLLYPEGTIQHAGIVFDKIDHIGYHIYRGYPEEALEVNRIRRMKAVTGACMLVQAWAFKLVGGFDEGYINGFEDLDLCLKLGEINGEIYYTPSCRVFHYTSSTPGRTVHDNENALRFRQKWFHKIAPDEDIFLAEDGYRPEWRGNNQILHQLTCEIIIIAFNNLDYNKRCLESVWKNTSFPNYRITVVDNGSSDGSKEYFQSLGDRIRLINLERNIGFGAGCNLGASESEADYLVLLNNDTEVQKNWLSELVKSASAEEVAIVGCKLLYPDLTVQHSGVVFDKLDGVGYHIYAGQPGEAICVNREREFQAVTGACMLVKRKEFLAAGGFDEGYLNGREDIDLCFKIRNLGRKIKYNPKSTVIHYESKSSGRKDMDSQNLQRFRQKWGEQVLRDEDRYYQQDHFRIVWDSRSSYHLEYFGPRAGILIIFKEQKDIIGRLKGLMEATVFPDYVIYFERESFISLPQPLQSVVKLIETDDYTETASKIAEPIKCIISGDLIPAKGWLCRLVEWANRVGGGELIVEGEVPRGKGFPELDIITVKKIKYFKVEFGKDIV